MWHGSASSDSLKSLLAHFIARLQYLASVSSICLEGWVTLQNSGDKTEMGAGMRGSLNSSLTAGSGSNEGARRVQSQPQQASCSHREECSLIRQPHRVSAGALRMLASEQQCNVSQYSDVKDCLIDSVQKMCL